MLFIEKIKPNDFKPENIIINKERNKIYFIDFGVSTFTDADVQYTGGTPRFISPEKYLQEKPTLLDVMYS